MSNNLQDNTLSKTNTTPAEPTLCTECCEFFGSSVYNDLCSGCFRKQDKMQSKPQPKSTGDENVNPNEYRIDTKRFIEGLQFLSDQISSITEKTKKEESASPKKIDNLKCHKCPRKAGALAFQCKCGHKFCKNHRLPEEHDCTYDFAKTEKEKLKQANPVVKGSKLERF